jgi:hypothetical protein
MTVHPYMAVSTECYKIILLVAAEKSARPDVVHVEVLRAAATLATPAIAGEDLLPQAPISLWIEPQCGVLPV